MTPTESPTETTRSLPDPGVAVTRELLDDIYPDLVWMDEYDECIAGVCERFGQDPILIYDKEKVLERLVADGMTPDEAIEFWEFNQIGAWVGDQTPCFLTRYELTHD